MTVWPQLVVILSAVIALALSQHGKDLTLMDKDTFQGSVKFPLSSRRQSEVNSRTAIGSLDGVSLSGAQHKCAGDDAYSCSSGDMICQIQVCDGVADCPDWDDESNCECSEGTFLCDGGRCIDNSLVCDGILDCADGTDEECGATPDIPVSTVAAITTTATTTMPLCLNGAAPRLCQDGTTYACFCDGVVDCPNREDEHRCKPAGCGHGEWRCKCDGSCIPSHHVCNRRKDCLDGSDERGCVPGLGWWKCRCGGWIKMWQRCDGRKDCRDGSDERMCPHHHHCHGSHHRLSPLVVRHRFKHLMAPFSDDDVDSDEY